jgi:uncharacterized protein
MSARRRSLPARTLLGAITAYQWMLSPWLGTRCRHLPTCSAYAAEAIERFGAWRGGWLAVKRLGRCQPWGTSGYDPVPSIEDFERHRSASGH